MHNKLRCFIALGLIQLSGLLPVTLYAENLAEPAPQTEKAGGSNGQAPSVVPNSGSNTNLQESTPPKDAKPPEGQTSPDKPTAPMPPVAPNKAPDTQTQPADRKIPGGITCSGGNTACVVDATGRALRIVTRTATPLFAAPDQSGKIKSDAVAAFQPAYVFARKDLDFSNPTAPQGWYQVGYIPSAPIGWMRAADVMEWRQALLVAYRHPGSGPERRPPVLQFETLQAMQALVQSASRQEQAKQLYHQIADKHKPKGVIATEPLQFVDIDNQLYFTPILEWKNEPRFEESHYLHLMNAVPGTRALVKGEGTLDDNKQLEQGLSEEGRDIRDLRIDVKFVIDMTGSMQPYIDRVTDSIADFVNAVKNNNELAGVVRFGLIGYRDDHRSLPELEWTTKNFTPDLVSASQMLPLLQNGGKPLVSDRSSDDWQEDMLAGVRLGLQSSWSNAGKKTNAMRFIILIGDASGHPANSPQSTTHMRPNELNEMAKQANVSILSVHLKDDYAQSDWPLAQQQFKILGKDSASETEAQLNYVPMNTTQLAGLSSFFNGIINRLKYFSQKVVSGDNAGARKFAKGKSPATGPEEQQGGAHAPLNIAENMFRTALVEFLGSDTPPGKDFLSWIHDYDLLNPNIRRVDIRVLISRQDMDNIIRQTQTLYNAMVQSKQARVDFYKSLQWLSAQTALGQDVQADKTLGQQEYLPRWVAALPYKSEVLNLEPRNMAELSVQDKGAFESRLRSKLSAYQDIFNNKDRWISLDEGTDTLQMVTALPLTLLP